MSQEELGLFPPAEPEPPASRPRRKRSASDPDALAEQVRSSFFHPDDPDYLKQAWKEHIDQAREDRASQLTKDGKPKKTVRYSWDSELAMRAYWRAVVEAKNEGYEAFGKLDLRSPWVSILPPDDDTEE